MEQEAAPRVSIWERLERPAQAPRTTLTHRQIAEAAIEIADAEGIDSVSMRRLAGRLGVATMALYRYVSSKEDIFELMIDAVSTSHEPEIDATDWRTVMRGVAAHMRAIGLSHPWLAEISARFPTDLTPNRLAGAERALASVDGLGLDSDSMMGVISTVQSYAFGATGRELAILQLMKRQGWESIDDLRRFYGPNMAYLLGTGRYPTFHRYLLEGKHKDDGDWRFEFGLECVLDGIAARLGI